MTTKVKNTVSLKTSQGEVIVAKGKLMLLDYLDQPIKIGDLCNHGNNGYCVIVDEKHLQYAKELGYIKALPVIISETEEIEMTDSYLFTKNNTICLATPISKENLEIVNNLQKSKNTFKILALPESFTVKHLKVITSGKLKNNTEVYVECVPEQIWGNNGSVCPISYMVNLSFEKMVTLHKVELDVFADMRALGLTSDQCSEVCDYIEKNFNKK